MIVLLADPARRVTPGRRRTRGRGSWLAFAAAIAASATLHAAVLMVLAGRGETAVASFEAIDVVALPGIDPPLLATAWVAPGVPPSRPTVQQTEPVAVPVDDDRGVRRLSARNHPARRDVDARLGQLDEHRGTLRIVADACPDLGLAAEAGEGAGRRNRHAVDDATGLCRHRFSGGDGNGFDAVDARQARGADGDEALPRRRFHDGPDYSQSGGPARKR
jgi:hypothetical protein